MICLICRETELVRGFTPIIFERGELRLVVDDVPAHICPSCGEVYVDEDVARQLLWDAEAAAEAGIIEAVRQYGV